MKKIKQIDVETEIYFFLLTGFCVALSSCSLHVFDKQVGLFSNEIYTFVHIIFIQDKFWNTIRNTRLEFLL